MALSLEQQHQIRQRFAEGASPADIMKDFNISLATAYKYRQGALGRKLQKDWKTLLESKSKKDENGCWVFGNPNVCGISNTLSYRGTQMGANRASYLEFIGPIPPKDRVSSVCGNVYCINPEHLRLKSEDPSKSPLSVDLVKQIRKDSAEGRSLSELALSYGVSSSTISRIVNRKIWQHVE